MSVIQITDAGVMIPGWAMGLFGAILLTLLALAGALSKFVMGTFRASNGTTTRINNLPATSVSPSTCQVAQLSVTTLGGNGSVFAGEANAYMPTWAATNANVYISGTIFEV
jgi:hypothetical protein